MTFYTNRKQMIIAPQSVINTKKKSGKSLSYMTPILLNRLMTVTEALQKSRRSSIVG